MKNNYQCGDVVYVDLGTVLNEVLGHEQAGNRPCIIIKPLDELKLAIIVPCTSKAHKLRGHYSVVEIEQDAGNLGETSYALCHQIRTISTDRIRNTIGHLPDNVMVILPTLFTNPLVLQRKYFTC